MAGVGVDLGEGVVPVGVEVGDGAFVEVADGDDFGVGHMVVGRDVGVGHGGAPAGLCSGGGRPLADSGETHNAGAQLIAHYCLRGNPRAGPSRRLEVNCTVRGTAA